MALQVFTASLLKEGLVVYLCLEGDNAYWSTELTKATTTDTASLDRLQAEADRAEQENIIIAPYAIDVDISSTGVTPSTKREQIRATGPTFRLPQAAASAGATAGLHAA
ncbi:MAG: DUF2849 domain-containing protein [Sneathiella sp.]